MGDFRAARAFAPSGLALLALLWISGASAAPAGAPALNESVKLEPKEFLQSQPPTDLDFARDVVRAMRAEYLQGEDGAVGAFLDGEAISEKVGKSVEAEEKHIRMCPDPQAELSGFEDHEEKALEMTGLAPEAEGHAEDLMEVEPAAAGVRPVNASTEELFFGSRRRIGGGGGAIFDSRRRSPVFYDSRRRASIYYDSRRRTPYYYGSRRRTTYIWWGGGGGGGYGYGYGPGYGYGGFGDGGLLLICLCFLCCGWFFCYNGCGSGGMFVVREQSFQEPLLRPQYIQPVRSVPAGPTPDPGVARGFVAALRAEYLEGRDGAVGDFMNSAQISQEVGRTMEAEEENVRTSYDKGAALRDLEVRWNLVGYVQPTMVQPTAPGFVAGGIVDSAMPPFNPEFARRFVDALRAEYLEGMDGAVGAFQNDAAFDESLRETMESEEERIRLSPDRYGALRDLEFRWGI